MDLSNVFSDKPVERKTLPGQRPWPVEYMTSKEVTLWDWAVKNEGRSFHTVDRAIHTVGIWPEEEEPLIFAMGSWHVWGRQSFRVAPLLGQALHETSLQLIPSDAMRSPYPAIWVEAEMDLGGPLPPLMGFFLLSGEVGQDRYWELMGQCLGMPQGSRILQAIGVTPVLHRYLTYLCLSKETLEQSIEDSSRRAASLRAEMGKENQAPSESARAMMKTFWGFASCFLLYLSSPDPDLETVIAPGLEREPRSKKAKEIQDRIRAREGEVRRVGYRLTRVIRRSDGKAAGPSSADPDPGRSLRAHLVRGHFKNQPFGPGRTERRIIWIAPYRRGDDGTEETLERTYAAS